MPTYQFEAMDATGQEIRDVIEAPSEEEAQATIRQRGYFVTKIAVKKSRKAAAAKKKGAQKRGFTFGGVSSKQLTSFTRQLSILQDAGLPILRSLRILEGQSKPGRLKYSLMDVCDEIEAGSTLSEAMAKSPKAFNRLYVNMIKAGEAGGALEIILQRLAEFQEKAESLKRKIKGAMVYPIVVVLVAVGILTFIMLWIVPRFQKIFDDFGTDLPVMTKVLIAVSTFIGTYFYLIPLFPFGIWMFVKLVRKFRHGRYGWDLFTLQVPVFGQIIEKTIVARSTRTLGTLVASGVPILEALNIAKETSGNAVFEGIFSKIYDAIREGEAIARPLKDNSRPKLSPVTLMFWFLFLGGPIGVLLSLLKMKHRVIDDLVVNMVDVGEETGELDKMLYKVADQYDEEVNVLTESLLSLLEPLLIIFLGVAVGFIVIALFLPLIKLIQDLT